MREAVLRVIVSVFSWALRRVERYKNRGLAYNLHRLADLYDPRPETWGRP
jgi:hypothetical protein